MISLDAPAKVNLLLRVGPRGPDGFHPLRTLFCALTLADRVEVEATSRGDDVALTIEWDRATVGPRDLGPPERNLAVRAARAFVERAGLVTGLEIRLHKRIPAGGGLGGGSSDAAAVLRALDRMSGGTVPVDDLAGIGADLGSDVPFFLAGGPLAWGAGRGDRLTPLDPLPSRPVLVVVPPFPVGTADAYAWLDEARGAADAAISADATADDWPPPGPVTWDAVRDGAVNDLEGVVFERHPGLAEIKGLLERAGAEPALMAGSGSTVFGVFRDEGDLSSARRMIEKRVPDARVAVARTAR